MAPPPPASLPLMERLKLLAQTLQFAWFLGHFTLILAVSRYLLSCITFSTYSGVAQASYRFAFVAAAATYGIVVYKSHILRGQLTPNLPTIMKLAGDENVQYLCMAIVWLFSRQLLLALLPFAVYSFFHVATYTRTYLVPTFQPPTPAHDVPSSPSGRPVMKQSALAERIGNFIKTYYDTSMDLVAGLELSLMIRLIGTALTFSTGSWVLLVVYFWFFRSRFSQSSFVQATVRRASARVDATLSHQSTPPAVRQAWGVVKNLVYRLYTVTDLKRYLGRYQQAGGKKPQ
ncbi:hypothetical protein FQN57_001394 [Myotisia sp. PD_48]|nr:hypothetical protein FQN57_001394 [Myotisia sp. PD_48]